MAPRKKWKGNHSNPAQETAHENTPAEVKKREARNKARYQMMKQGKVHKGDGKEVDHKKKLAEGGSNSPSNWRVRDAIANRKDQPKHKSRGK